MSIPLAQLAADDLKRALNDPTLTPLKKVTLIDPLGAIDDFNCIFSDTRAAYEGDELQMFSVNRISISISAQSLLDKNFDLPVGEYDTEKPAYKALVDNVKYEVVSSHPDKIGNVLLFLRVMR